MELTRFLLFQQLSWKLSQIFTSIMFIDNVAEKWPNTFSSSTQISGYLNEFFPSAFRSSQNYKNIF